MTSQGTGGTRLSVHNAMARPMGLTPAEFGMEPSTAMGLSAMPPPVPTLQSPVPALQPPMPLGFEIHGSGDSSSDSHSPEMTTAKASDRESRIIAEKHRRSEYNSQISQITSLLTDTVHPQRRMDKTSVLRLAANKLRNEHVFGNTITCAHLETWSPAFLKYFDLFGGVMLAVTCRGRIFNVSPNVQEKLGYCYVDLLGQDIYNYVHPEDRDVLKNHIYPAALQTGCDSRLFEQRHNFHIRIMRAGMKSDAPRYEQCRFDGTLRRSDKATANSVQDEKLIKRQRVRHHRTFSSSGNDYVFIGMVQILSTVLPSQILAPNAYSEYWTRHLLDGRIVQCEYSISLATGYMSDEVTGTSGFVFMHKEDVRWVVCVLRQMYDQSKEFGESYYRLMNRSGNFIYMRTRGFLEIDKDTKELQSFVCVNSVIGDDYGRRMMQEMKRKYSVIVDVTPETNNMLAIEDAPVEDTTKIENIVMHLLEPPPSDNLEDLKLIAPTKDLIITAIRNSEKLVQDTGLISSDSRKRKNVVSDDDDDDDDLQQLKRHSGI